VVKLDDIDDSVVMRFRRPPRAGLLFDLDTGEVALAQGGGPAAQRLHRPGGALPPQSFDESRLRRPLRSAASRTPARYRLIMSGGKVSTFG